jgi:hypothetical protein
MFDHVKPSAWQEYKVAAVKWKVVLLRIDRSGLFRQVGFNFYKINLVNYQGLIFYTNNVNQPTK